jgi:dipeptidyl aminopeptidase/acylaminoacyl peptidase
MATAKRRNVEIEDLFRLRVITGADVSPDGDRIVFSALRLDLAKNANYSSLYAVPARGGRVRRLTRGDHVDGTPRFSPDGTRAAFLSNRGKVAALWILPMDGGEPERITDRDHAVTAFAWAPDGKTLAVCARKLTDREKLQRDGKTKEVARLPDFRHVTRLRNRLDGSGFFSEERTHIFLVRATGGRMTPLTKGKWEEVEPRFSPDGTRVSFLSNRRKEDRDLRLDDMTIFSIGLDGKGLRRIKREEGPAGWHVWGPDGKHIYYLGHLGGPEDGPRPNYHVRRVPSGGGASVDLTPDLDRHAADWVIGDVTGLGFGGEPIAVDAERGRLLFNYSDRGACHLAAVPLAGGDAEVLVGGERVVFAFGLPGGGGPGWALVANGTSTGDLHRLDPASETPLGKRVTRLNDAVLGRLKIVEPEEVRFESENDGYPVHGWLMRPPSFRKGRRYPLVLNIHGGPGVAYGHVLFHEMQLMASRGYMVLMLNPRGSDGYGSHHRSVVWGKWAGKDMDDLLAGVDGLVASGDVDPERLFLTGGSYGGYMTNMMAARTDRFRAAVSQRSVSNYRTLWASSDFGYLFAHGLGGPPWEKKAAYERLSPVTYAAGIDIPFLIIHSEQDLRTTIGHAEELFRTLKIQGKKDVEMVRFVGESHGLSRGGRPQNRAERLRRILGWFKKHGGR